MKNGEISREQAELDQVELAKQQVEDVFASDRGERALYQNAAFEDPVLLPVTRDGLNALLERAASFFSPALPIDESMKSVYAAYEAHIDREIHTVTIKKIAEVLYKAMAHKFSWTVDQEVKIEAQKKVEAAREAQKKKADAAKIAKAEEKRARRGNRVTVSTKDNETAQ